MARSGYLNWRGRANPRVQAVPADSERLLEFPEQEENKVAAEEIQQVIAQLDHEEFQQREAAMPRLIAFGSAAKAELEKVARTTDSAEVRFRAR